MKELGAGDGRGDKAAGDIRQQGGVQGLRGRGARRYGTSDSSGFFIEEDSGG